MIDSIIEKETEENKRRREKIGENRREQ